MNQFSGKALKTVLIFTFLFLGFNGCKDDFNSVIPETYVDFYVNRTSYIEFNIPGGSYYFPGYGYGGVIIFRDLTDSSNPFLAFDAACPYEVSSLVRVVADESGIATCPVCQSQFILFGGNGAPIKGPAAGPLKQYRTSLVGGRIFVKN